jgi:hypothetical protein
MISITAFFAVGGFAAVIMRLQLLTPHSSLVEAETYNKLFTLHGVIMVFFFLVPSIPTTLGNFLVPLMIGARDLAIEFHRHDTQDEMPGNDLVSLAAVHLVDIRHEHHFCPGHAGVGDYADAGWVGEDPEGWYF